MYERRWCQFRHCHLDTLFSAGEGAQGWAFLFDLFGGAMNDTPEDGTAFPHRNSIYFLTAYTRTTEETPAVCQPSKMLLSQPNVGFEWLEYASPTVSPWAVAALPPIIMYPRLRAHACLET